MKQVHLLLLFIGLVHLAPVFAQNYAPVPPADGRTVKLSPKIRVLDREETIPTIPMDVIQHFLNRPKLISEEQIQQSAYVLANAEDSLLSSKGSQIYVTGIEHGTKIGTRYMLVKVGQLYRDFSTEEDIQGAILAREAIYLGEAVLQKMTEPAVFKITQAIREIKQGDLLVPLEKAEFSEDFYPDSPTRLTDAYIIAIIDDVSMIGKYQIVVINQGSKQLKRGHLLTIVKKNQIVHQEDGEKRVLNSPPRPAGELLVFKVFKKVSYALVRKAWLPVEVLDQVSILETR